VTSRVSAKYSALIKHYQFIPVPGINPEKSERDVCAPPVGSIQQRFATLDGPSGKSSIPCNRPSAHTNPVRVKPPGRRK
jgi:hypothetical protein